MYVREYLKSPVITITSATLIHNAQKIIQEHKIHHLPVVDRGKLLGVVTQGRIRDAVPPSTGSLSMWEFNYLLSKMKVSDVMIKDIITVSLDATIEG